MRQHGIRTSVFQRAIATFVVALALLSGTARGIDLALCLCPDPAAVAPKADCCPEPATEGYPAAPTHGEIRPPGAANDLQCVEFRLAGAVCAMHARPDRAPSAPDPLKALASAPAVAPRDADQRRARAIPPPRRADSRILPFPLPLRI
ncbi:MAG: hypothetical protein KF886_08950 [Candidatus Hydrogenedentes bacterium]|nr:hypothetical protein [Candidatus Hydrogenedentota bacterium]